MSQDSTIQYLLNLIVHPPTLDDIPGSPDPQPATADIHQRASEVLASPHPSISQYFFPQISPDVIDRVLALERLTPLAHFFRDAGNLESEDVMAICRVLSALRDRNHPELLAAFQTLRCDEFVLNQLHNPVIVQTILEGIFLNLSFRNLRSVRNISSPAEPTSATENLPKVKVFDFSEEAVLTGKSSDKQAIEELPKNGLSTFLSRSQRSISRSPLPPG